MFVTRRGGTVAVFELGLGWSGSLAAAAAVPGPQPDAVPSAGVSSSSMYRESLMLAGVLERGRDVRKIRANRAARARIPPGSAASKPAQCLRAAGSLGCHLSWASACLCINFLNSSLQSVHKVPHIREVVVQWSRGHAHDMWLACVHNHTLALEDALDSLYIALEH